VLACFKASIAVAELPVDATTQAQQAAHHAKRTDEMTRGVILTIQPVWILRRGLADNSKPTRQWLKFSCGAVIFLTE